MVTKSDMTALKASVEAQNAPNRAPSVKWWKPLGMEGEYVIRILPPTSQSGVWYLKTAQYHLGQRFFYAPYIIGQPDPIFDYYRQIFKSGNDSQIPLAKTLRPRNQYLCNIVVRDQDGNRFFERDSVSIFSMGQSLYDLLMAHFWDKSFGDITDVYQGFDVRIVKKQRGTAADYTQSLVVPQSSPLAKDAKALDGILRQRHNLASTIIYNEPRVLQAALDEYLHTVT